MDICVLGPPGFVLGFRLAGIKNVYEIHSEDDLSESIRDILTEKNISIVIMPGDQYERIPKYLKSELESSDKLLLVLGDEGERRIREKTKRVMGVDLWRKE